MTSRLVQKRLFRGSQEFELVGDEVRIRIRSIRAEETLTVTLSVLNPEPVIKSSRLEFTSRVNGESLISLYLGKPNTADFNAFVNLLTRRARDEYNTFAGLRASSAADVLSGNVYDDPHDFDDAGNVSAPAFKQDVDPAKVGEAIRLLTTYLGSDEIGPLLSALEALKTDPQNETCFGRVLDAFTALGVSQGAVLTYAPYLNALLSDDPFGGD